ncbi:MAG TPA: protein kinase [Gemmatimonadaceae bacterium]|nr:protein kinase [Gemmatimonadaceae bacterium]
MSDATSSSPIRLHGYQIERELGHGGMATVYLARDVRHDRVVAVKVIKPDLSHAFGIERFQREIAITAKLAHPNILPLHDSGEADGRLYYVTPYVPGESLRARLNRERQLPVRDAIVIARGIASALEHAHAHGVVHRDIKPENVLLADGQPIVADFGIARALEGAGEQLTSTGVSIGTPTYMSPEQAAGEHVDERADIYSLGCVLYEMLAGEPPFTGPTTQAIVAKKMASAAPDVRQARDTVDEQLASTVARMLARVPADRVQTATELRKLLDDAEHASIANSGVVPSRARGAARQRSARRAVITAAAALVTAAAVVFAVPSLRQRVTRLISGPTTIHTLAVLPLVNLSGDMSQDYLADGLTDALINGLSEIGSVNVISRTSVSQYKMMKMKKSLRDIGRDLHADAVLEASVGRDRDRVRISGRLVRVADEHSIWNRTYERQIGNALELENDIASDIAEEIGAKLVENPAAKVASVKPEAQEAYLKGSYLAGQSRFKEAIAQFQVAVEKDPNHSAAYAALARAWYFRAFFGEVAPVEAFSQMERAAQRALEHDPRSAEALGLMALVNVHYRWDWVAAKKEFERALALAPSNAQVHHDYAHFLLAVGRSRESAAETERARELDPANPMLTTCTGWHNLFDKQFDTSLARARESQMMMPNFWAQIVSGWALLGKSQNDNAVAAMRKATALSDSLPFAEAALANALAKAGKKQEAQQLLDGLLKKALSGYVSAYDIAIVYAGLGDNDQAIAWLQKAINERSMFVVHMTWDARLDGLRADPRFNGLVKQLGAPTTPMPSTPVT